MPNQDNKLYFIRLLQPILIGSTEFPIRTNSLMLADLHAGRAADAERVNSSTAGHELELKIKCSLDWGRNWGATSISFSKRL